MKIAAAYAIANLIDEKDKFKPASSNEKQDGNTDNNPVYFDLIQLLDHMDGKDICTLFVEINPGVNKKEAAKIIQQEFKTKIGIQTNVKPVDIGELPRSEKKSTRIFDNRY